MSFLPIIKVVNIAAVELAVFLVKCYRLFLSPIIPKSCRFTMTCSQYAISSFRQHGFVLGSWLTIKRLLRCNPFCSSDDE